MDIDLLFDHHPPSSKETIAAHEMVRSDIKTTAHFLNTLLPESTEKTLAIRKLQEAQMWAHAAIAIYS